MELDFTGADDRSATELRDTLKGLAKAWPGIEPPRVTVGTMRDEDDKPEHDKGTMAQTSSINGEMVISKRFASDYGHWQRELKKATTGDQPALHKGLDWRHPAAYTATHEFGHVLTRMLGTFQPDSFTADQNFRRLVVNVWKALGVPETNHMPLDIVPVFWDLGLGRYDIADDLSGYAATSPPELIAEGFAVATLAPGTSKVADAIMAFLKAEYDKKYPQVVAA